MDGVRAASRPSTCRNRVPWSSQIRNRQSVRRFTSEMVWSRLRSVPSRSSATILRCTDDGWQSPCDDEPRAAATKIGGRRSLRASMADRINLAHGAMQAEAHTGLCLIALFSGSSPLRVGVDEQYSEGRLSLQKIPLPRYTPLRQVARGSEPHTVVVEWRLDLCSARKSRDGDVLSLVAASLAAVSSDAQPLIRVSYTTVVDTHVSDIMPVFLSDDHNKEWSPSLMDHKILHTKEFGDVAWQQYKLPWPLAPREIASSRASANSTTATTS